MGSQRWGNLTQIENREKARKKKGKGHIMGFDVIQSQEGTQHLGLKQGREI